MVQIPLETQLIMASILFVVGLMGLLIRRNIVIMLISMELMMNSAGWAFIAAGAHWRQPDGQVMFLFILAVAAAEVAVALAIVLKMHKLFGTLNTKSLNE